jgi:hypothetical protein
MLYLLMVQAEELYTLAPFFLQDMRPWQLNKSTANLSVHILMAVSMYPASLYCMLGWCAKYLHATD